MDNEKEKLETEAEVLDSNEDIKVKLADAQDKYLRALADFENYKKRVIKERSDLIKYQGDRIFTDLLDIVDNFELALKHADADPSQLKTGIDLIYKLLTEMLVKWEVKSESSIGSMFDPNKHNALSRLAVDDAEPGLVINEFKKAYYYKDRLLRPAEVVVSDAKKQDS